MLRDKKGREGYRVGDLVRDWGMAIKIKHEVVIKNGGRLRKKQMRSS